jgi:hypothetical protein
MIDNNILIEASISITICVFAISFLHKQILQNKSNNSPDGVFNVKVLNKHGSFFYSVYRQLIIGLLVVVVFILILSKIICICDYYYISEILEALWLLTLSASILLAMYVNHIEMKLNKMKLNDL